MFNREYIINLTFKDGSMLYTKTAKSVYVNFEKNEFVICYRSGSTDFIDIGELAYLYVGVD